MPKPDLNTVRISRIFKAVRAELGINQTDACELLNLTQGALSKIESASINPSLFHWMTFVETFDLSPYCFKDGYIDRADIKKRPFEGSKDKWKLPQKYKDQHISVRTLIPVIESLREEYGEEKVDEIFNKLEIRPEYFVIRDNMISLTFVADFFNLVSELRNVTKAYLFKLTGKAQDPVIMGKIFDKVGTKDKIETAVKITNALSRLEKFGKLKVSKQNSRVAELEMTFNDSFEDLPNDSITSLEKYIPALFQGIVVNTAKAKGHKISVENKTARMKTGAKWNFTLKAI